MLNVGKCWPGLQPRQTEPLPGPASPGPGLRVGTFYLNLNSVPVTVTRSRRRPAGRLTASGRLRVCQCDRHLQSLRLSGSDSDSCTDSHGAVASGTVFKLRSAAAHWHWHSDSESGWQFHSLAGSGWQPAT